MGREIEVKIPLSKDDFDRLFDSLILCKNNIDGVTVTSTSSDLITKRDEYYSKYSTQEERRAAGEPQVIRIRTEEISGKSKSYFTLKFKKKEHGIELNKEDETFVENPEVLREFFSEAGYQLFFDKVKKNYSANCESELFPGINFHAELENVNDLLYLEVEVVQEEGEADVIKQSLFDFLIQLGLNPENRDIRSWMEILLGN